MIGKIFRYTFIILVFIAIFCFIFKLDDIVGGMPIKAKATSVTIPKKTSKTITAPETVKPVAGPTNATVTVSPKAMTVTDTPVETPPAPSTSTPAPDCAPNATSQDPCKLGQCFGYPYGVCESNPNQGSQDKACASDNTCTNPDANYFDLWGNEFTYNGTLIQASTEQVDPVSGQVNPYYVGN